MVVGVLAVDLRFSGCGSLKEKRMHLRRLTDRLRREFNLSLCEVEHQNLWQRSRLGLAHVNTSGREAEALLGRVLGMIESYHGAEVLGQELSWW